MLGRWWFGENVSKVRLWTGGMDNVDTPFTHATNIYWCLLCANICSRSWGWSSEQMFVEIAFQWEKIDNNKKYIYVSVNLYES